MIMGRDIRIMEFLKRCAIDNPGTKNNFKLAAALVLKRDIISLGYNQMRTHPLQSQFSKNNHAIYLHAEINAIASALNHIDKKELRKASLYVARVKRSGPDADDWVDGLACPCSGCASAILAFGISRVIHTTDSNENYEERYYA